MRLTSATLGISPGKKSFSSVPVNVTFNSGAFFGLIMDVILFSSTLCAGAREGRLKMRPAVEQDYQIRDINNMGAAMAPAASATLLHYLRDTHAEPPDFDAIYTGDLGHVGSQLFRELLAAEGLLIKNHVDCGCILYDASEQAVKSGGSGAGCCAAVLCAHILPRLERGTQKRVLFLATGALMSQTTFLQKESIPAVAHLVELAAPEKGAAS